MVRMIRQTIVPAAFVLLVTGCVNWPFMVDEPDEQKPVGLIQLIEFEHMDGLRNWAYELDQRGLKSLVFVTANILEEYPEDIKWLADEGHEIAGGYSQEPLWDVDYETQLAVIEEAQELVETVTEKPMRVFGSRYFAYDENTLKAAEALGVEYVLARGTSDVEAIIYQPDEYDCKIISVSNVTFEDMGRGSLCDYSLWARGSTAAEFADVVDEAVAKQPERIMVASHAYLGGVKKDWWDTYENLLDGATVEWAANFDVWVTANSGVNLEVPLALIPENREVLYTTPTPSTPLDELEDLDQLQNPCAAP